MTLLVPSKLSISLGAIRAAFATLIVYFLDCNWILARSSAREQRQNIEARESMMNQ